MPQERTPRALVRYLWSFLVFLGSICAIAADLAPLQSLQDAEIGVPMIAGEHSLADGVLTIHGAGKGDDHDADQLHYTYCQVPGGDIEVIARLASLSNEPLARAGLMLRADNDPKATIAAIAFSYQAAAEKRNMLHCRSRDSAAPVGRHSNGGHTYIEPPFWMRLVRVGKDFGVYKSLDGNIWSLVHNASGGAFTVEGPISVGFFVSNGNSTKRATATFDNITIREPKLEYRSSWIGTNFCQNSTGHVTGTIGALHVGTDGSCYTNSHYDEAGQSAKIYKDGKVVKAFENPPFGNNLAGEGSITGDGTRMYLASMKGIYATDMLGRSQATQNLFFATDFWDTTKKINAVSGMAVVNGDLFVSHARDNKILVGRADAKIYYTAGNSSTNFAASPIVTTGIAHAAPAAIYQSQRECDYLPYQIPDLDPKINYLVRLHFAEYSVDQPGKRLMNISAGGQVVRGYDLFAAGGKLKPAVLDIPDVRANAQGTLAVVFERGQGGNGHIVVCGFEILKPDGSPAFRINCGGGPVDGFQSDVHELTTRVFAFERPGPMVADKRNELWIIQHATDTSPENSSATQTDAAIKCYRTDGTFTGRQITDAIHPTAVAYDSAADRLLIAENGPDQNIRIYENLTAAPKCTGNFGVPGGVYTGKIPGRLFDAEAGGWARLYGPIGVGVDAESNIYVACSGAGSDLRKYTPKGELVWMLGAHHFVDCADFDPDSDGTELYCPFKHYTMDYSQTAPGSEWKYTAFNWNPLKYGSAPRPNVSSAVVRRLGPNRNLVMYTSGQGNVDYAGIFRFDGDIAVPCGRIGKEGGNDVWIDKNGDGKQTPDERSVIKAPGEFQSFAVDQAGDLWTVWMGGTPVLRHFFFKGLNAHGVPQYGTEAGDYEDIPFPGIGSKVSTWGQVARVVYDSDRDVMYLIGPAKDRKGDKEDPIAYLARYDGWRTGNRTARWLITLPDPASDPNFMYASPFPYGLAFHWMAFDVAVDKIFVAEMWGPIHVFDAATGKQDTILNPGPEVSGSNAWEDEQMGVRAFKRKNGEYLILSENSGYYGMNNLFRWKP